MSTVLPLRQFAVRAATNGIEPMENESDATLAGHSENNFFLPDLCKVHALLLLVIGTETGALIFALINSGLKQFNWHYFALTSFFMLWIVLASAFSLCLLRRLKLSMSLHKQGITAYFVVIVNTVCFAVASDLLVRQPLTYQWDFWFILETVLISSVVTGLILRYFYLQHLWQQQQRAELLSRVDALQARIRPHFLFNSLNSIVGLIHEDADTAEEAVLDLAELFRATLKDSSQLVTLRQELALCHRYLRIEKLRLGERLSINWQVKKLTTAAKVPPLCIQPIVENAIYHGIQPKASGGMLDIVAEEQDGFLYVMISNPLLTRNSDQAHKGNRMAMVNIKSRLSAFFGAEAVLKSSHHQGKYTATLRIPLQKIG